MKKLMLTGAAAILLSLSLVGCSNTAEGAKEDTANNGQKVAAATNDAVDATKNAASNAADATKKAADNAADATKKAADNVGAAAVDAGKNTTAALEVTPKVKLAITADKELNDTRNTINVDSKDSVVHLKGTVISNDLKKKAGAIADKTLKDMNSTDKVSNELMVTSH